MVEYSPKIDWKINVEVRNELVKRWIDVSKLRISSTRGIVEISGTLVFIGKMAGETEPTVILNTLRAADRAIRSIYNVRDVNWKLSNWRKTGGKWTRQEGET